MQICSGCCLINVKVVLKSGWSNRSRNVLLVFHVKLKTDPSRFARETAKTYNHIVTTLSPRNYRNNIATLSFGYQRDKQQLYGVHTVTWYRQLFLDDIQMSPITLIGEMNPRFIMSTVFDGSSNFLFGFVHIVVGGQTCSETALAHVWTPSAMLNGTVFAVQQGFQTRRP